MFSSEVLSSGEGFGTRFTDKILANADAVAIGKVRKQIRRKWDKKKQLERYRILWM